MYILSMWNHFGLPENRSAWRSWPGHWPIVLSLVYRCTIVGCNSPSIHQTVNWSVYTQRRWHWSMSTTKTSPWPTKTIPKLILFTTNIDQHSHLLNLAVEKLQSLHPTSGGNPSTKNGMLVGMKRNHNPCPPRPPHPCDTIWSNPIHVYLTSNYAKKTYVKKGYKIKWNQSICLQGFANNPILLFKCWHSGLKVEKEENTGKNLIQV